MRRTAAAGVLCAALLAAVASPARGDGGDSSRLVAPGVELRSLTRVDPAEGLQELRVLRFRLDDPRIRLRPVLAQDHGGRFLPLSQLVLRSGAVAAVNGNFAAMPSGNVRGIHTVDGILRSEPEAPVGGAPFPRAAWRIEGTTLQFGRPSSRTTLTRPRDGQEFALNGINRILGYLGNPDESVLETPSFDTVTATPAGGVDVVLDALPPLTPNTDLGATVTEVREGSGPIVSGGAAVTGSGSNASQLRNILAAGDPVKVRVEIPDPGFAAARVAAGGGPVVVRDGGVISRSEMMAEGFDDLHVDRRHPRTGIGRTADGTVVLLTVDGRQPGRSEGVSLAGLARLMIGEGVVEGISVDGGGSTELSVDGRVVNVPSDPAGGRPGAERPLSEAVGVFYDADLVATRRAAGGDRIETAIAVSRQRPTSRFVLIATSTDFPDALVGGPLAAALGAPLLLTPPSGLDLRVADEIARLGATEALVLGGPAAMSPQVETDLAVRNVTVRRIAGPDRYATAASVASSLPRAGTVLIASGQNYPDALSAGAVGLPVLLTAREALPGATAAAIGADTPVVVGGPAAVSPAVLPGAPRIAGGDRYGTSAAVADWAISRGLLNDSRLLIARGDAYPDALVGGALRRPLLLVGRFSIGETGPTNQWLDRHGGPAADALLLGGRTALSTMTEIQVDALVRR